MFGSLNNLHLLILWFLFGFLLGLQFIYEKVRQTFDLRCFQTFVVRGILFVHMVMYFLLNCVCVRYQRQLKKPLFFPDEPTVDTEPLYETMEGKMGEFIAELRQHGSTLISTLCESQVVCVKYRGKQGPELISNHL